MDFILPTQPLFLRRENSADPRLGDLIQTLPSKQSGFVIAGYPDDEGIRLNSGRPGACEGPNEIRRHLYKMTPALTSKNSPSIFDAGNLPLTSTLKDRHQMAEDHAFDAMQDGHRWIGLGGGHDYGYPDGAAFLRAHSKNKPLVINFDAHLDVRPTDRGLSSGTPFYRLLDLNHDFDFVAVGIQNQCNSQQHFQWCKERGATVITWDEIAYAGQPLATVFTQRLGPLLERPRPVFISVDVDAFGSDQAMGCSQSWPTGLDLREFLVLFHVLLQRHQVQTLGVYEVSPPLDQDGRTAKLAAQIVYQFLFHESA